MKNAASFILILLSLNAASQSQISWNAGGNIAASSSGNDHPRIVMDASGNPLVLWGHSNRAMFSRWDGTTFTTPVMLNPMTMMVAHASWMGPDIAAHGDTVYVVFKQIPEGDSASHIYIVRSFDAGVSFSPPVKVDSPIDTLNRFPTVTTDPLGNPLVALMTFNYSFGNAQWAVAKSTDFGDTFSTSVLASGWSSAASTVCDCCPGQIVSSGNNVAVLYRDNNNNIRDSWAGLSTDGGATFSGGWNIDQNNWQIFSCPATGPDGIIIGDSMYSVFASGMGGMRVHRSTSSLSGMTAPLSQQITGTIPGLTQQNFPRIAHYGNAVAMVWKQFVSGAEQLPIYFTADISSGFPTTYDTVDLANIASTDVAVGNGKITVVWEDEISGTVKYRSGTFTPIVTAVNEIEENDFLVYPNPATNHFLIGNRQLAIRGIEIIDLLGQKVFSQLQTSNLKPQTISVDISSLQEGIYFIRFFDDLGIYHEARKIIITNSK